MPLTPKKPLSVKIQFRVDKSQKDAIDKYCKKNKVLRSDLIRHSVLKTIEHES